MSIIKSMRRQFAVYWERGESDQFGNFSFSTPVEIRCRWEDVDKQIKKPDGEVAYSKATVYVDRVMKVGDILQKGEMDSDTVENPLESDLAWEIVAFEQLPKLRKVSDVLLTAYLGGPRG